MHVSVVIPAYNESATITPLLQRVLKARQAPHQWEILVVDDFSADPTIERACKFEPEVRVLRHPFNLGKGAALKTGFAAARGEVVIVQDADLEYDPAEYKLLLQPIMDGDADVVFGSRFGGAGPHRVLFYWHYVGNRFLTMLSNITTNLNLTDMECGLVAVKTEYLRKIRLVENRFANQPEMTVKLARLGARFYEVGITYHGRSYAEGKKITWRDGVAAMVAILRYGVFERLFG